MKNYPISTKKWSSIGAFVIVLLLVVLAVLSAQPTRTQASESESVPQNELLDPALQAATATNTRTPTPINIGNFVWSDLNNNGIQDSGEPGLGGITVQLWDAAKTNMIAQTTTNASGLYSVQASRPGDYRIRVLLPTGATFTFKDSAPDDLTDSDINTGGPDMGYTDIFTIASNVISITTKDAGLYIPPTATRTRTPTPINIGNFVWSDLNGNGIQDTGEPGVGGVDVQLWDATKTNMLAQTTTNSSGLYSVRAPRPGDYRIRVILPAGATFSPKDSAPDDQTDSDINTGGVNLGYTDIFTIASNVISITTKDAGLSILPTATPTNTPTPIDIGDFVWNDLNSDGVQDAGEPGLNGVTVQLWDAAKTNMFDSDVTDINGNYNVFAPSPGDYRIRVLLPNAGDSYTVKDQGSDTTDSDINPGGADIGFTDTFNIASNAASITTVDAGIIPSQATEIEVRNGGTVVPNGGQINYGITTLGAPLTGTFDIYNIGTNNLLVSIGTLPAGFTLTSSPASPIPGGSSTSFSVRCDAGSLGIFSALISIANNDADEDPYTFTITCTVSNVFTITPPTLPNGVVGVLYSQTVTAVGGVGPFTYSILSGALPDGLTLNPNSGLISGTPTTVGSFSFVVQADDQGASVSVSQDYTIQITPAPVTVTPSSTTAANNAPPPPPVNRCVDENFIPNSSVRAKIPDAFSNDLRCRIMVQDGQFLTLRGRPLYNWGNIGNQELVNMGVVAAVDVFNTVGLRQFHDAVICLRGTGKAYLLNDTFSEAPRAPMETTAYTVPDWPGFTCVTLYSPATVVLVRNGFASTPTAPPPGQAGAANQIPLTDCRVYVQYALRLRAQPDQNSAVVANVPFDQTLTAIAMVPGWYRVRYGNHEGWLSADYLLLYGQC